MRQLAFLNSGVKIVFQDAREENSEPETFYYEGGVMEMVKYHDRNETVLNSRPIVVRGTSKTSQKERDIDVTIDIALQWNAGYREKLFSFTNNIPQKDHGTHVQGFRTALTKTMTAYAENNLKSSKKTIITAEDIREGLTAVISVKVPDPKFSSQTKEKLVSSEVTALSPLS